MISVNQDNPKAPNSKSFIRYNQTITAKTIGEFMMLGGKVKDLICDYSHNFIEMGTLTSLRCIEPALSLAYLGAHNIDALLTPLAFNPDIHGITSLPQHALSRQDP